MDQLQNRKDHELIHCRYINGNNEERLTECVVLDSRGDEPLREPEVTVSLNDGSMLLLLHPLEEPEEDIFDYEADISSQEGNTDSEEQVVPSSQLSNCYKYPEDLTISDDEIDEGIFEDDPISYNLVTMDDNNRHDSQPP